MILKTKTKQKTKKPKQIHNQTKNEVVLGTVTYAYNSSIQKWKAGDHYEFKANLNCIVHP